MPHLTIIHISDLHYSASPEDDRRLSTLKDEINEQLKKGPAQICFSGDLTYSGQENEFNALADKFFLELHGYDKLFFCPGNHDIIRDRTDDIKIASAEKTAESISTNEKINTVFADECPLEHYINYQDALSDFTLSNFFCSIGVGQDFQIASINTSWASCKRPKGYTDKGNLKVDERSLDEAIKNLSDEKIKILMMHHPISWLTYKSQSYLTDMISKHFDLVLYGHEHDPTASSSSTPKGGSVFCEATAAKANWSNGLNGYSVISVDTHTKHIRIRYRSYSNKLDRFIDGDGSAGSSPYYPRPEDKEFWLHTMSNSASHLLDRANNSKDGDSLEAFLETAFSTKSKYERTPLIPKFERVKFKNGEQEASEREILTDCLQKISKTTFFVGPKDSGLTTSCHITYKYLSQNVNDFGAIPIYIDAEEVSSINKATLSREVQRGFIERFNTVEAKTLIDSGSVIFLFDSLCIHDTKLLEGIKNTLESFFPNCRSIVFCSLDKRSALHQGDGLVDLDPSSDTIYGICELDPDEIKKLINIKAATETENVRENLLNNTVISFKAMDEPVYATTVSILVDTLRQLPDFRPINRVRLLDRYIECLLGRYTIEDVRTGQFNSSEKSKLLSYLAGEMVRRRKSTQSKGEVESIIKSYTTEMMLEVPDDILSEFCEKGILFASGDQFTFRANSIFSYFVAKEMERNRDLFEEICDGDNFFSHHTELVFYGELEGVDSSKLLTAARTNVQEIGDLILRQYAENGIDFKDEWERMVFETSPDEAPLLEETIEKISEQVPNDSDKDLSRLRDLSAEPRSRGVKTRNTVRELEAKWLISIRVYLQLLKYSSSIPGKQKVEHLRAAFLALERFAQSLAVKREKISKSPMYSHSGILYINPLAAIDVERSAKDFKYSANLSVAQMASELMGNSQLNLALAHVIKIGPENEFQDFLIRNLLMDIPSRENASFVIQSIVSSGILTLQIASLRELKSKYVDYKATEAEQKHHKSIILGLNKEKSVRGKLNLQGLDKKLALSRMKRDRLN